MWNAKVKCVNDSGGAFKLGNIYEVKSGVINYEDGDECGVIFDSLSELNYNFNSKFELVSEELPQPHKSLLKDGYKVKYYGGDIRYVLIKTNSLHYDDGMPACSLDVFDENLIKYSLLCKIAEIYDENDVLIAKRTEKSPQQLEIESIENEIKRETEEHNNKMKKLADRLGELGKEIMG